MEITPRDVQAKFVELFKSEPLVLRAPGRINLIGEHVDYNDGFVMPAAVDKEIFFAIGPSNDGRSIVHAIKYDQSITLDLNNPTPVDEPRWANYLLGVVYQFKESNLSVKPFNCVFGGNVPVGAGMSSSAAMECGFAVALSEFNLLNVPKLQMVKMAQWTEHNFVGVKVGIMDPFASLMSKKGHVIVLDCRSITHHYAPLELREYTIVLCDTRVKHSLVDSEYNTRRKECEAGLKILQKKSPAIKSLRDASVDLVKNSREELPGKVYQRCLFVVEEILRVQRANDDLQAGNLTAFGKKMYETHDGLSRLYEVSCVELDFLVQEAKKMQEVIGARMMGGGFGGCTINLVKESEADAFISRMTTRYKSQFGIDMTAYKVKVVDGVSRVPEQDLTLWT